MSCDVTWARPCASALLSTQAGSPPLPPALTGLNHFPRWQENHLIYIHLFQQAQARNSNSESFTASPVPAWALGKCDVRINAGGGICSDGIRSPTIQLEQ